MEKVVAGLDLKMGIAAGALAGISSIVILFVDQELFTHDSS